MEVTVAAARGVGRRLRSAAPGRRCPSTAASLPWNSAKEGGPWNLSLPRGNTCLTSLSRLCWQDRLPPYYFSRTPYFSFWRSDALCSGGSATTSALACCHPGSICISSFCVTISPPFFLPPSPRVSVLFLPPLSSRFVRSVHIASADQWPVCSSGASADTDSVAAVIGAWRAAVAALGTFPPAAGPLAVHDHAAVSIAGEPASATVAEPYFSVRKQGSVATGGGDEESRGPATSVGAGSAAETFSAAPVARGKSIFFSGVAALTTAAAAGQAAGTISGAETVATGFFVGRSPGAAADEGHVAAVVTGEAATAASVDLLPSYTPFTTRSSRATGYSTVRLPLNYHSTSALAATAPRLIATASATVSSSGTAPPAGALLVPCSTNNLVRHASITYWLRSPPVSRRTFVGVVADTWPSRGDCAYSTLAAPLVRSAGSPAAATAVFSAISPLPADATFSGTVAAPTHQSPLSAHNGRARTVAAYRVEPCDGTVCKEMILHEGAACPAAACDTVRCRVGEMHGMCTYDSNERANETGMYLYINRSRAYQICDYVHADGGGTHIPRSTQTRNHLLFDPHVQQPVQNQQQHPQHHTRENPGRPDEVVQCRLQHLAHQRPLLQRIQQDNPQRERQQRVGDGLQQPQQRLVMVHTVKPVTGKGVDRCRSSFPDQDSSVSSSLIALHTPPAVTQRLGTPDVIVPMLLRWRPKKSFKKKTMNLPSTKARRRWARLRR